MSRVPQQATEVKGPTGLCFPTFTVIGAVSLLLLIGISWLRSHRNESPASQAAAAVESEPAPSSTADAANQSTAAAPVAPLRSKFTDSHRRPESNPVSVGQGSRAAERLIGELTQLQIAGKLTPEQGQQIQRSLQQLVAQGAAALPAIREFLDKNLDLPFGDDGSKLAGVPSLRAGLIDSLRQIGGPEAIAVSRQVLQNSADPLEISLLARNLEEVAPGQYRQETLDAARQALAHVAAGNLDVKDVGPLFQVLQTYGDSTVAAELEKLAPQWNYYATMALAGLPGGQGIASLVDLAHQPPSAETGQYNKLPFQMLGQLSSQYPDASSDLMDMVRQGQIPDSAWRAVAAGLAGNQYQFTRQLPQDTFP
jgi:hypothetical protein